MRYVKQVAGSFRKLFGTKRKADAGGKKRERSGANLRSGHPVNVSVFLLALSLRNELLSKRGRILL